MIKFSPPERQSGSWGNRNPNLRLVTRSFGRDNSNFPIIERLDRQKIFSTCWKISFRRFRASMRSYKFNHRSRFAPKNGRSCVIGLDLDNKRAGRIERACSPAPLPFESLDNTDSSRILCRINQDLVIADKALQTVCFGPASSDIRRYIRVSRCSTNHQNESNGSENSFHGFLLTGTSRHRQATARPQLRTSVSHRSVRLQGRTMELLRTTGVNSGVPRGSCRAVRRAAPVRGSFTQPV